MKLRVYIIFLLPIALNAQEAYDRGHHHHHSKEGPSTEKILDNIIAIIANGIIIAHGQQGEHGENHLAIAQHLSAIIHEMSKSPTFSQKKLPLEEVTKLLREHGVLEGILRQVSQKNLATAR